jgi:multisubunit Na+/H+ antiporter MnhB subunit
MFILDLNSFSELFSGKNLYFMLIASAINAVVIFYASLKFVLSLQQSGYRGKRYFKWLASPETPYLSRLMLLCLMGFLFFLVLNTCFTPMVGKEIASYVGFASYLLFSITYINTESSVNAKVPLRKTKRLVRLCITYVILLFLITFGLTVISFSLFAHIFKNLTTYFINHIF